MPSFAIMPKVSMMTGLLYRDEDYFVSYFMNTSFFPN